MLRVSDVLANVSGVYVSGNTGGYQEEISGRGFAFGSSNTLIAGTGEDMADRLHFFAGIFSPRPEKFAPIRLF